MVLETYQKVYYYSQYFVYFLYVAIFLGVWNKAPQYLSIIHYFLQFFVGVVLVYFFNPLFSKRFVFTQFHRNVAFSAGIFILTSMSLNAFVDYISWLYNDIKNIGKGVFSFVSLS
jgi:formate hydrogenlyase subunit 4